MTSIEWFVKQLMEHLKEQYDIIIDLKNTYAFEKSEEMHKQEIINTWSEATAPAHEIGLSDTNYIIAQIKKAEQYYQKTFKKD